MPRKNERSEKPDLIVSPSCQTDHKKSKLPDEYTPLISCGRVSLVGSQVEFPITILRDTDATQSLILEGALPFSSLSDTGMTVLLQGAELGTFRVPLHKVHLKCGLVTAAVVVGVRPSLPVQGVSLILGNDLAGGQVACISNVLQNSVSPTVAAEQVFRVINSNSQQDLSREQIGRVRCLPGKKMVDNQIFVGRLPKHICSRGLEDIFFPYGKLTRCKVKQGIRLAYGFVEFENRRDAEDAIRLENGREIMGTIVRSR